MSPSPACAVPAAFYLDVSDGHRLFVATAGAPGGEPVLVLHGGPGSGCSPRLAELYDPARHWLVMPDQRGAGRSAPAGACHANTTAHLIADLERLRRHLGIARWRVTGGSWGATLALLYAAAHPAAVIGVVARSVFLPGAGNVAAFFAAGGDVPAERVALADAAGCPAGGDVLAALARRLDDPEPARAVRAAVAWAAYERALAEPEAPPQADLDAAAAECLVRKYRVQAHYLQAGAFVTEAGFLDACASLPGVPVTLIHGRLDRVCPPDNARRVHARIPGSRLVWVDGCGHAAFHPAMVAAWRQALGARAEGAR